MYFVKIDFFRRVLQVIIADQAFIDQQPGMWVQCDIDGVSPKNYPGIGFSYDYDRNAFISPKPFPSWILNESSCQYEAPSPRPEGNYVWDEESLSWKLVE